MSKLLTKPEHVRHAGGRPSLYKPSYCDQVVDLGCVGASRTQMAAEIGIARETLNNWARKHPEFLAAIKRADEAALTWWECILHEHATTDHKGNLTAVIFAMKNRFKEEYGIARHARTLVEN